MMGVKSFQVGLVFTVGVVSGLIFSFLVSTYSQLYAGARYSMYSGDMNSGRILGTISSESNGTGSISNNTIIIHRPPLSHEELDQIPVPKTGVSFNDARFHQDDESVSNELVKKVRILCWIMTQPENLQSRASHVRTTWGKRCNKLIFVSDKEDKDFPTIPIKIPHGRDHLTAKTMAAFDYVYKNHFEDADWFMKADDDTYAILENMRYMLSAQDPSTPVFFGHHFKVIVNQGYFSGGGGYIVSKEALKRYGERASNLCAKDQGAEDVEFGRCMEKLKVVAGDSRDAMGRSRFHCFNPETHLHGGYPDWYYQYDKYGAQKGIASMSDYAITFHYVSVQLMYDLEYYIYHLRPYGIITGLQNLNSGGPPSPTSTTKKKKATTDPHTPSRIKRSTRLKSNRSQEKSNWT